MQVFTCRAISYRRFCRCGNVATRACDFALGGAKAGQTCDLDLCECCAVIDGIRDLCRPHAKHIKSKAPTR